MVRAQQSALVGEYKLHYDDAAGEISAEARFDAAIGANLVVEEGSGDFVEKPEVAEGKDGAAFAPIVRSGSTFKADACARGPCRIRYRYALRRASKSVDDLDIAAEESGAIEAPPSSWLVAPADVTGTARVRFRVTTSEGARFATGVFRSTEAEGAWDLTLDDLWTSPYSIFGPLRVRKIDVAGGVVEVALAPGKLALDDDKIVDWVENAAKAVTTYVGQWPMPSSLVILVPAHGRWVGGGRTLAGGGGTVFMRVGERAPASAYKEDWVIVHEMIHLVFPSVARNHNWAEEGIATYVEPFARVRAGQLGEIEAWRGLVEGVPNGLPAGRDAGLDHTPTWGRVYWGGALFWLLVDVELHKRTQNAKGVEHVLRGFGNAGMSNARRYTMAEVVAVADRATGTTVVSETYEKMRASPHPVDLDALWKQLGIEVTAGRVRFDEKAPLASVRRAIATGKP